MDENIGDPSGPPVGIPVGGVSATNPSGKGNGIAGGICSARIFSIDKRSPCVYDNVAPTASDEKSISSKIN